MLGRSVSGVRKLLSHPDPKKRPPAFRVGGRILFYADELEAFVRSCQIGPRPARPQRRVPRSAKVARLHTVAEEARA